MAATKPRRNSSTQSVGLCSLNIMRFQKSTIGMLLLAVGAVFLVLQARMIVTQRGNVLQGVQQALSSSSQSAQALGDGRRKLPSVSTLGRLQSTDTGEHGLQGSVAKMKSRMIEDAENFAKVNTHANATHAGHNGGHVFAGDGDMSEEEVAKFDVLVVGAGLSGAVLADMYARFQNKKVLVVEHRDHVGGACHDFVDAETGILMSKFGPHVLHTNMKHVWQYLHRFTRFLPYEHREIARVQGELVPMPVNIETVYQLRNISIHSASHMLAWLKDLERPNAAPSAKTFSTDQAALLMLGKELYRKMYVEHAFKMWNRSSAELYEAILSSVQVNKNFDDRQFPEDQYQGLPEGGYTAMIQRMLNDSNIVVRLKTDYFAMQEQIAAARKRGAVSKIFFTGRLDHFFINRGSNLPPLPYRSITFVRQTLTDCGVVQPMAVVNYPEVQQGIATRSVEYKHFYRQKSKYSVVVSEFPTDTGEPCYPSPFSDGKALYQQYQGLAVQVERGEGVHFVGRLAQYANLDMDDAVDSALKLFATLEGQGSVDKMLDGMLDSAPLPSNNGNNGSETFVVHFSVALYGEDLKWIRDLCLDEFWKARDVSMKFFIYVKKPSRSLESVELEVLKYMAGTKCSANAETVDVRRLENVGRETHTHLKHMFGSQFEFGDANVFLQGQLHSNTELVVCGLRNMKQVLWDETGPIRQTRASHPDNIAHDIFARNRDAAKTHKQTTTRCDLKPQHFDKKQPGYKSEISLFHFVPLQKVRYIFGPNLMQSFIVRQRLALQATYWRFFMRLRYAAFFFFFKGEFIVSEALLRRMLARYRTMLWDLGLDQELAFTDRTLTGYVFEGMWYSLFNDALQDPEGSRAGEELASVEAYQGQDRLAALEPALADIGPDLLAPMYAARTHQALAMMRIEGRIFRHGMIFDTRGPENSYKGFSKAIQEAYARLVHKFSLESTRRTLPPPRLV